LIVNDYDAVVANRRADIPSSTLQDVDVTGHLCDLHLDFAEVLVLSGVRTESKNASGKKNPHSGHDRPQFILTTAQTF
jgi:hypothetical protein